MGAGEGARRGAPEEREGIMIGRVRRQYVQVEKGQITVKL